MEVVARLVYTGPVTTKHEAIRELKLVATSNQLIGVAVEYPNQWDDTCIGISITTRTISWYVSIAPIQSDLLLLFLNILSLPHITKKMHNPLRALTALSRISQQQQLALPDTTNVISTGEGNLSWLGVSLNLIPPARLSEAAPDREILQRGADTSYLAQVTLRAVGSLPDPMLPLLVHSQSRLPYKPPRVRLDGIPWGSKLWKLKWPPSVPPAFQEEIAEQRRIMAELREQRRKEGRPTA